MILAADIGGTHTRLLLGETTEQGWQLLRKQVFLSRDYPSFDAVLQAFLVPSDRVQAACLAVAGPVLQQCVRVTHLPWQLDAALLATQHGFGSVELVNDFVAQAYGLPLLLPADLLTLQVGSAESGNSLEPVGNQLLVGAGTGLGIATSIICGAQRHVIASEGGHADFAPQGEQQSALHAALRARFGRVSLERVLSGSGLENIYHYVNNLNDSSSRTGLRAADISAAAAQGDAVALAAMALFLAIYASTAGNLALTNIPHGGVYITGGIAPKIAAFIDTHQFVTAFCDKAPREALLQSLPLHVVLNDQLGLLGAAEIAAARYRSSLMAGS